MTSRFALVLAALCLVGCGAAPASAARPVAASAVAAKAVHLHGRAPSGPMMFIGGGADQDDLMKTFMTLSGGADKPLVIVPLASDDPAKSGQAYVTYLQGLGARHVRWLVPSANPTAEDLAAIAAAGGCFFSGGDQARVFAGLAAPLRDALRAASRRGAVMAGTSAGAMVWGDTAIMGGDPYVTAAHGIEPGFDDLQTAPGLAVAPGWVVDTHFSQRGRVPRLAVAVALTQGETGLGVDPMTAAIVRPDGTLEVQGRGTVTVLQVPHQAITAPVSLHDVHLDILAAGGRATF